MKTSAMVVVWLLAISALVVVQAQPGAKRKAVGHRTLERTAKVLPSSGRGLEEIPPLTYSYYAPGE